MKRQLFAFILFIASPCLGMAATVYPAIDVQMTLEKVSEHVYYVQGKAGIATDNKGFISNAAVVISTNSVLVFDALGSPSLAAKLVEQIRQLTAKPITTVFISHYHADHIYGLQVLKEQGATIYAPKGAERYYNSEFSDARLNERRKSLSPWINKDTRVVKPDQLLEGDQEFKLDDLTMDVIQFGSAHSDSDLALYIKQDDVLLSGDLIFTGRIPFVGGNEIENWIAKIDYLAKIPAKQIVPGHGGVFTSLEQGADLTRSYLILLRDSMNAAVDDLMSFEDAYSAVDWRRFHKLPAFERANRGNAYRVFLASEAKSLSK
ncbi:MAG: MBL fold metallo-hydrolase [Gammaproteobacteria bacterium]|nr:MBL fold metallo-hydrolase [Gammaproteobacteria bacterium]